MFGITIPFYFSDVGNSGKTQGFDVVTFSINEEEEVKFKVLDIEEINFSIEEKENINFKIG